MTFQWFMKFLIIMYRVFRTHRRGLSSFAVCHMKKCLVLMLIYIYI